MSKWKLTYVYSYDGVSHVLVDCSRTQLTVQIRIRQSICLLISIRLILQGLCSDCKIFRMTCSFLVLYSLKSLASLSCVLILCQKSVKLRREWKEMIWNALHCNCVHLSPVTICSNPFNLTTSCVANLQADQFSVAVYQTYNTSIKDE
jgi:hypothetical protein